MHNRSTSLTAYMHANLDLGANLRPADPVKLKDLNVLREYSDKVSRQSNPEQSDMT